MHAHKHVYVTYVMTQMGTNLGLHILNNISKSEVNDELMNGQTLSNVKLAEPAMHGAPHWI